MARKKRLSSGRVVALLTREQLILSKERTVLSFMRTGLAFIGAGAVVNRDVPDFMLVVGNPARQIGWMSRYGEQIPLPLEGNAEYECPHTGDIYKLEARKVILCK